MGFLALYLPSLTETTKRMIEKYAEEACLSFADKIKGKGSVKPDDYNELLRECDEWFMKKTGIEDSNGYGIMHHILHWVLKDSGARYDFFVTNDKKCDKSRIYGDGIKMELIPGILEGYKPVLWGKSRKALCHE
jgi:hypothetical protein